MTIEQVEVKVTTSAKNLYRVPLKQWKKWRGVGQRVFNGLCSGMTRSPDLFAHPGAPKLSQRHWKTTVCNAAWIAASAARDAEKRA